jgi:hypothetical protein
MQIPGFAPWKEVRSGSFSTYPASRPPFDVRSMPLLFEFRKVERLL